MTFLKTPWARRFRCGVYDMGLNEAWVNVGRDHDTPGFAVASIRRWWSAMGQSRHPDAQALYITADAGGSNGYRAGAWTHELQNFADDTGSANSCQPLSTRHE